MTTTTVPAAPTSTRWYWACGKRQGGPVTWQELQALAAKGKLRAGDWVFQEGTQDWQQAGSARPVAVQPPVDGVTILPPPPPTVAAAPARQIGVTEVDESLEVDGPPRPATGNRGMRRMIWGTGLFLGGILGIVLTYNPDSMLIGGWRYMPFRVAIILGIIQFCRGIAEAGSDA